MVSQWEGTGVARRENSCKTQFKNSSVSLELKYVWVIGIGEELLGWEKYSCKEEKRGWEEMTVSLNTSINHSSDAIQGMKPQL